MNNKDKATDFNPVEHFRNLDNLVRDENFDSIDFLSRLIQCKSVTPVSDGAHDLCAKQLEEWGFETEIMTFTNDAGEEITNLVASYGSGHPHTVINGHLDVVPPGKANEWTMTDGDPFAGLVTHDENGTEVVAGRGAIDMKGPVVASMAAANDIIRMYPGGPSAFPGRMTFVLSGDEETGGHFGTRKVVEEMERRGDTIDQCVVVEPSSRENDCDEAKIGCRGIVHTDFESQGEKPEPTGNVDLRMNIAGGQGHTGHPQDAVNPIWRMGHLLKEVCNKDNPLIIDGKPVVPVPVSAKSGGNTRNLSPDTAMLRLNMQLDLPQSKAEKEALFNGIAAQLESRITASKPQNPMSQAEVSLNVEENAKATGKAPEFAANNPIMQAADAIIASEKSLDNGNDHFSDASQMVPTQLRHGKVLFDCRFNDEWNSKTVAEKIQNRLTDGNNTSGTSLSFSSLAEPFYSAPKGNIEKVLDSIETVTGRKTRTVSTGGASDMRFFKCPTIEVGPRDASIHAVNEHIPTAAMHNMQRIMGRVFGDIARERQAERLNVNANDLPADITDGMRKIRSSFGLKKADESKNIVLMRVVDENGKPDPNRRKVFAVERDGQNTPVHDKSVPQTAKDLSTSLKKGEKMQILNLPRIVNYAVCGTGNVWNVNEPGKNLQLARFLQQYNTATAKAEPARTTTKTTQPHLKTGTNSR